MTRITGASTTRRSHALLANGLVVLALLASSLLSVAMPAAAQTDDECLPEGFADGSNPNGFTCEPGPEGNPVVVWKAEDIDNYWAFQDNQVVFLESNSNLEVRDLRSGTSLWSVESFDNYWPDQENHLVFLESNGSFEVRDLRSGKTLLSVVGYSNHTTYADPEVMIFRLATTFEVRDLATGELLWSEEADDATSVWAFGEDDSLVAIEQPGSMELRDVRTGDTVWTREVPENANVQSLGAALYLTEPLESDLALEDPPHREIARLDTATGQDLWRQTVPGIKSLRTSDERVLLIGTQTDNTATPGATSTLAFTSLDADTGETQWNASIDLIQEGLAYITDDGSWIILNSSVNQPGLTTYLVLNAATGETIFSHDLGDQGTSRSLELDDDTTVFVTYEFTGKASDDTGARIPAKGSSLATVNTSTWTTEWEIDLTGDASNFLISEGVLYATVRQQSNPVSIDIRAYDTVTGQERWRSPLPQMAVPLWIYDGRLYLHDSLDDDAYESWSSVDANIGQSPQLASGGCTGGNLYPVAGGAFCVFPEEVGIAGVTPHALWMVNAVGTGCEVLRSESPEHTESWFFSAYDGSDYRGCGLSIVDSLVVLRAIHDDDSYDMIALGGDEGPNAATPGMLDPGVGLEVGMNAAIVGGDIPLRGAPATSGVEIASLAEGAIIELMSGPIEENGETWWQVRDPATDRTGYVPAENLSAVLN